MGGKFSPAGSFEWVVSKASTLCLIGLFRTVSLSRLV
jgi:hypothetical protein